MRTIFLITSSAVIATTLGLSSPGALAQDAAAEMAAKLQNPLANIKSIMTDNNIDFESGNTDDIGWGVQIQPVYAVDFLDKGFTLIPRAIIPIVGVEPGTDRPILPPPDSTATNSQSGISDSVIQLFYAPHSDGAWKFGFGPQVSIPTATKTELEGPQWGGGAAGIVVGNLSENISFAGIVANLWGENDFNTMILQPMIFWNFAPGKAIAYNAAIAYSRNSKVYRPDWKGHEWTFDAFYRFQVTEDITMGPEYALVLNQSDPRATKGHAHVFRWKLLWLI